MSIRDISLTPRNTDHLKNKSVAETQSAAVDSKKNVQSTPAHVSAQDRVEISEAGRKAQAGDIKGTAELDFARKALLESKSLSDERVAQIRSRLQEGYYQQKAVTEGIAEGLERDLKG